MITKEELSDKYDNDDAKVLETKYDGTCILWHVKGHDTQYVELSDGSIITQDEDNENDPIFPYDQYDYRESCKKWDED